MKRARGPPSLLKREQKKKKRASLHESSCPPTQNQQTWLYTSHLTCSPQPTPLAHVVGTWRISQPLTRLPFKKKAMSPTENFHSSCPETGLNGERGWEKICNHYLPNTTRLNAHCQELDEKEEERKKIQDGITGKTRELSGPRRFFWSSLRRKKKHAVVVDMARGKRPSGHAKQPAPFSVPVAVVSPTCVRPFNHGYQAALVLAYRPASAYVADTANLLALDGPRARCMSAFGRVPLHLPLVLMEVDLFFRCIVRLFAERLPVLRPGLHRHPRRCRPCRRRLRDLPAAARRHRRCRVRGNVACAHRLAVPYVRWSIVIGVLGCYVAHNALAALSTVEGEAVHGRLHGRWLRRYKEILHPWWRCHGRRLSPHRRRILSCRRLHSAFRRVPALCAA